MASINRNTFIVVGNLDITLGIRKLNVMTVGDLVDKMNNWNSKKPRRNLVNVNYISEPNEFQQQRLEGKSDEQKRRNKFVLNNITDVADNDRVFNYIKSNNLVDNFLLTSYIRTSKAIVEYENSLPDEVTTNSRTGRSRSRSGSRSGYTRRQGTRRCRGGICTIMGGSRMRKTRKKRKN